MCCNGSSFLSSTTELSSIRYKNEVARNNFSKLEESDIEYFKSILGSDGLSIDVKVLDDHNVDYYRMAKGQSQLLLLPESTEAVSQILKYCNKRKLALTPQGGNTGLVAGGVPVFDEIILSMVRMNKIYGLDELTGILTTQAGSTLATLNRFVDQFGYIVPLDLAPDEKCQIGGNVATNAGGLRYFRYGSLQENVTGLEVVILPSGDILDLMNNLKKDNTGYHLKHLFIGSEGTIGIVTKVSIKCPLKPKSKSLLLLGLASFDFVLNAYRAAQNYFQSSLSCCELIEKESMNCVIENLKLQNPAGEAPYYILLEVSENIENSESEMELELKSFLKTFDEFINSRIATNLVDATELWKLRRGIGDAVLCDGYAFKYDFSIPLEFWETFFQAVKDRVKDKAKRCCLFGHLGDNNLHLVVTVKEFDSYTENLLEPFLYEWIAGTGGSVSAEHGIGLKERKYLKYSKSEVAIDTMKKIKNTFDPNGILNPYKIFV